MRRVYGNARLERKASRFRGGTGGTGTAGLSRARLSGPHPPAGPRRAGGEKTYLDFWGEDDSAWSLPWRCKICADGIGEAADIAASDVWPGGAPTRAQAEDHRLDPGSNAVLARSARGQVLLEAALADGALVSEGEVGPRQMDEWQPHQLRKKRAVQSRFEAMRQSGRLVPETRALRLEALQALNSDEENRLETEGSRRRLEKGAGSEARPQRRRV